MGELDKREHLLNIWIIFWLKINFIPIIYIGILR